MSARTAVLEFGRAAWRAFLIALAVISCCGAATMLGVAIWWLSRSSRGRREQTA